MRPLLAIFVGGRSSRMGTPKGKLPVHGTGVTILESLAESGRGAGLDPVLVGRARAYRDLLADVPRIDDDPPDAGPLGGLRAVAAHAARLRCARFIAVACDMPYVTREVLSELLATPSDAPILAPRRSEEAPWEPMLARYEPEPVLEVLDIALREGCHSFQELFRRASVAPLPLTPSIDRALRDWDTPADVPR